MPKPCAFKAGEMQLKYFLKDFILNFTLPYKMGAPVLNRPTKKAAGSIPKIAQVRAALGWTRAKLANVMNASDRAIVNWEQGEPMSPVYAAKLREIESLCKELQTLMKPKQIGPWLLTEMEEFENRTPSDLIARGETGRIWASIFYLKSGMAD
jgi:DNA-binding XRE family transcriptional regulator